MPFPRSTVMSTMSPVRGVQFFLSQNATGAAGDHRVSRLHVIKSADGTDDPPGTLFFHTQLNGTSLDW